MKTQRCPLRLRPGVRFRHRDLPLIGPVLDEFLNWLRNQRYTDGTIRNFLKGTGTLIRWLQRRRGAALRNLVEQDFESAYQYFRKRHPIAAATSRIVVRFLLECSMIRAERPKPLSRSERQIQLFSEYLREVRGLSTGTVIGHQGRVRRFLQFLKVDERPSAIRNLSLKQIDVFLIRSARTNNRFSLQHVVGSLRTFLRHQHAEGVLKNPIHEWIDRPRTYRLEQLPRALPWDQIVALLRSIERTTPHGLRDFTLLYLTAYYGLRSGEVVRLSLDDIDWREGILKITQTKSKQVLLLPLSDEAGSILANYLKNGRSSSSRRELFLRQKAPAGPLAPTAVHDILTRRIVLSGLDLPPIGSHVLRHSMAVHLLRCGVCLPTIGGTLGHRDPESTATYLRLATEDLREVGLSVPNVGRPAKLDEHCKEQRLAPVQRPPKTRVKKGGFRSGLAASLRRYLEARRALGRIYKLEEGALLDWDHFLRRRFGKVREVKAQMFQQWAESIPDPQLYNQKPGTGFPIARIAAIISLSCGAILNLGICRYAGKGQGEVSLLRQLWNILCPGDVLLTDCLMSNWAGITLLQQRGVETVSRLNKAVRSADFRRGKRLGKDDHLVRWNKPTSIRSVDRPTYKTLPEFLTIRETRIRVEQPGFRTKAIVVVTTLLDPEQTTKEDLALLYRERWNNELDRRSIKTTLQMDILRCKTPELVRKEIWTHVLAYNLIRTIMAQAAIQHEIFPRSISFKATLQALEAFQPMIACQAHRGLSHREELYRHLINAIAQHRVADRPDRFEPRLKKRRRNHYGWLTRPRTEVKRDMAKGIIKI